MELPILHNMNSTETVVRVGPAGWSYEDWKGIVYPPAMPRATHPLSILAPLFDTVEINSTFYRPAKPRNAEAWLKHVDSFKNFIFTAKLWQGYTHNRGRWPTREEERSFREGIAPLLEGGRLGPLLVQFPWSFRRNPENRRWMARILETFSDYSLCVELRHASWDVEALYEGLEEREVAFCNIDQPVIGESIGPSERVCAPLAYARFHGQNRKAWFNENAGRNERYNYLYSDQELNPWIERFKRMKQRVNELFIVTNNHYCGQAVVNALEIQAALGRATRELPPQLLQHYPRLERLGGGMPL